MMATTLSPAQQRALDALESALERNTLVELKCSSGNGRTTILRRLHARRGGAFLTMRELVEAMESAHPLAIEETLYRRVVSAFTDHDVVILDDLGLLVRMVFGCHSYPRAQYLNLVVTALGEHCATTGKSLVVGADDFPIEATYAKGRVVELDTLDASDYAAVCEAALGAERVRELDVTRVFRFARKLTPRQLRQACDAFVDGEPMTTDRFIEELRARQLVSNVDLQEVQAAELSDLKGIDDVIAALEAHVIVPFERVDLAESLDLRPKRGVLLAGPPGTGKTTIGRALARRLGGKFFLIDGTVIHGAHDFYPRIVHIFEAAKQNAPGIIFIDDSDVIFESGGESGLYRFLLTMLDGLESESAGRVCVIMTAMDVGNLPPALVRSGRIELWLETRYPDADARRSILADRCAALPAPLCDVEIDAVVSGTEGLSGADLKRVVEDAKVLFVYDRAREVPVRPATDYFLDSVGTVRANKERYAEAEARARELRPHRPPIFDVPTVFVKGATGIGFAD